MNKKELVDAVAQQANVTKLVAEAAIKAVFSEIGEALVRGERIKVAGFGIFDVLQTNSKPGRNLVTGQSMTIAAARRVRFRLGANLKGKLNG